LNTVTVSKTGPTPDPLAAQRAALFAAFPGTPSASLLAAFAPAGSSSFGRVRPISDHLRNPEIRAVNVGLQHEFSKTLVAEVQYIGQWGFGLFGERDVNAPPVIPDPAHPGFFYFGERPNTNFTAIRTNENSRTSHYNGLLVSASKRFSNHVQFNGSYTWSHALTSGEDFFGLSEPGDPNNIRAELGPAFNDSRHAANFGVVLDSGKVTDTRFLRWFTNDLGFSIAGQLQSGRPYPFSSGTAGFANGRFFGSGNETQQRPRVLPDGTISTAGLASFDGSNALFGPGAVAACMSAGLPSASCIGMQNTFLAPASASASGAADSLVGGPPVDFQFLNGNMGRDAGVQSPFYRMDISLKKTFRIARTEHMSLEIRADAFNVFNHPNWQGFNGNNTTNQLAFSLAGGKPAPDFFTCTSCMRPNGTLVGSGGQVMHFADIQQGKIDSNLGSPIWGGIGDPSTTELPRSFQLSFHFRF
jgi:hypothetical protein